MQLIVDEISNKFTIFQTWHSLPSICSSRIVQSALRPLCRNACVRGIVNRRYRDDKAKLVAAPSTGWGKLGKINARFPLSAFRRTSTMRRGKRGYIIRGVNIRFACRAWNLNVHGFSFVALLDFISFHLLIASFISIRLVSSSYRYSRSHEWDCDRILSGSPFLFLKSFVFVFLYNCAYPGTPSRLRPIQFFRETRGNSFDLPNFDINLILHSINAISKLNETAENHKEK